MVKPYWKQKFDAFDKSFERVRRERAAEILAEQKATRDFQNEIRLRDYQSSIDNYNERVKQYLGTRATLDLERRRREAKAYEDSKVAPQFQINLAIGKAAWAGIKIEQKMFTVGQLKNLNEVLKGVIPTQTQLDNQNSRLNKMTDDYIKGAFVQPSLLAKGRVTSELQNVSAIMAVRGENPELTPAEARELLHTGKIAEDKISPHQMVVLRNLMFHKYKGHFFASDLIGKDQPISFNVLKRALDTGKEVRHWKNAKEKSPEGGVRPYGTAHDLIVDLLKNQLGRLSPEVRDAVQALPQATAVTTGVPTQKVPIKRIDYPERQTEAVKKILEELGQGSKKEEGTPPVAGKGKPTGVPTQKVPFSRGNAATESMNEAIHKALQLEGTDNKTPDQIKTDLNENEKGVKVNEQSFLVAKGANAGGKAQIEKAVKHIVNTPYEDPRNYGLASPVSTEVVPRGFKKKNLFLENQLSNLKKRGSEAASRLAVSVTKGESDINKQQIDQINRLREQTERNLRSKDAQPGVADGTYQRSPGAVAEDISFGPWQTPAMLERKITSEIYSPERIRTDVEGPGGRATAAALEHFGLIGSGLPPRSFSDETAGTGINPYVSRGYTPPITHQPIPYTDMSPVSAYIPPTPISVSPQPSYRDPRVRPSSGLGVNPRSALQRLFLK